MIKLLSHFLLKAHNLVLRRISERNIGEVPQVNRVVYDIMSTPPGTFEWE